MIQGVLKKIFGSRNERLLKQYGRTVRAINALEPEIAKLSDARAAREDRRVPEARPGAHRRGAAAQARGAADGRRRRRGRAADEPRRDRRRAEQDTPLDRARREALDEVLPEAFAVVREAGKRVLNMRHFDVQLVGGIALHNGKIAEMRTGEGKTLVATLPAYLNALAGVGVHIVTVNDYLAQRDADWMGKIYRFLGLTVGVNLSQMEHDLKQQAYAADITYGTNNEFGFDYLRDNMVYPHLGEGAARALLRDRRRGRLDPDRRGAHAAHHLGPGRGHDRALRPHQRDRAEARSARRTRKATGDYWVDEKLHQVILSEAGARARRAADGAGGAAARRQQPVRRRQHQPHAPPERGAARAHAVPTATSSTSCRTARSSSSTSSPGA